MWHTDVSQYTDAVYEREVIHEIAANSSWRDHSPLYWRNHMRDFERNGDITTVIPSS